jgi:hypothetical protein
MWDGLQIIKQVIDAGAAIKVLDPSYIDLKTPMGRGFMAMMSAMAEDERMRIAAPPGHSGSAGAASPDKANASGAISASALEKMAGDVLSARNSPESAIACLRPRVLAARE